MIPAPFDPAPVRSTLASLWTLLYTASYRPISERELDELRTLLRLLWKQVSAAEELKVRVEPFLEALTRSGVLEGKREVAVLDSLIQGIDGLRELLP